MISNPASIFPNFQVILKQQRVIKKLLKKCYGGDFSSLPLATAATAAASPLEGKGSEKGAGGGTSAEGAPCGGPGKAESLAKNDGEDSDSAIMLDDHLTEVRRMEIG